MEFLRRTLVRHDPAQRMLALAGFKDTSEQIRLEQVRSFFGKYFVSHDIFNYKCFRLGKDRELTPVVLVEFASRNEYREAILREFERNTLHEKELGVRIKRARTSMQIYRNSMLNKALKIIKKSSITNA